MKPKDVIAYFNLREDTEDPRWAGTAKHVWRGHVYETCEFGRSGDEWWHVRRAINRYEDEPGGSGIWSGVEEWGDVPYRGVWVNYRDNAVLTYCEGDLSLVVCDTKDEFGAELQRAVEFYTTH